MTQVPASHRETKPQDHWQYCDWCNSLGPCLSEHCRVIRHPDTPKSEIEKWADQIERLGNA